VNEGIVGDFKCSLSFIFNYSKLAFKNNLAFILRTNQWFRQNNFSVFYILSSITLWVQRRSEIWWAYEQRVTSLLQQPKQGHWILVTLSEQTDQISSLANLQCRH